MRFSEETFLTKRQKPHNIEVPHKVISQRYHLWIEKAPFKLARAWKHSQTLFADMRTLIRTNSATPLTNEQIDNFFWRKICGFDHFLSRDKIRLSHSQWHTGHVTDRHVTNRDLQEGSYEGCDWSRARVRRSNTIFRCCCLHVKFT